MEIAASCDMRVRIDSARFGMPEVKFGIPSGMEACLLPGLIGWGKTREPVFTGEMIDAQEAQEAHRCGFLDRLVAPADLDTAVEKKGVGHPGRRTARNTHPEETGVRLGVHAGC